MGIVLRHGFVYTAAMAESGIAVHLRMSWAFVVQAFYKCMAVLDFDLCGVNVRGVVGVTALVVGMSARGASLASLLRLISLPRRLISLRLPVVRLFTIWDCSYVHIQLLLRN